MDFPFRVSWLHALLFWGCICFSPQKGYNIAHGYSLNNGEFSSHEGVIGPQTSNHLNSGASLNTNHDSVSGNDMQAMRPQSFVSFQREPVYSENIEGASTVASFTEEMESEQDSGHEPGMFLTVPSAPSVQKYVQKGSGHQHPFGLLMKEHIEKKTVEGISFPTMRDFKRFVETMKGSFLMPGSDLSKHFQTAGDIMENEMAFNAQNTERKKEGTAHEDGNENEVWSKPLNTVFEQNKQGANFQMPSERLSLPDPVDSTPGLISTSVYVNQDSGPVSALYPPYHPTTEHVSSIYQGFGVSEENPDIFSSVPDVQNEDVQSVNYEVPDQIPSRSFFREDFSYSVAAAPSEDFTYYSSKTSNLTPEKNIQQPKPASQDSLMEYQTPSAGFELSEDFQSENQGRVTAANVLSAPKPPPLNSYGKTLYVGAPRAQFYIPDYQRKHREQPAPLFQAYQPAVGNEWRDTDYTPTVHLPLSSGSVSSSSESLSPQSSSGHVGVQTSSPHDAQNQAFNTKQPVRSHQVLTVKLHGSSEHNGYFGDQRVGVTRPSNLTAEGKDESFDLSKRIPLSDIQEPIQMADDTLIPISDGLDSAQSRISSGVGVGYASFNSLSNMSPASDTAFSRLVGNDVMSRNFGIKNIISNKFPIRDVLSGSFSTPRRGSMTLDGGYVSTTRDGLPQTFIQPAKAEKRPANVNKAPRYMAYWPRKPLSATKASSSTLKGVFWRNGGNTERLLPQMGLNMSPSSIKAYIVKSRNSYTRSKVSLSKTHYAPLQLGEGKTGKRQWNPRLRKYNNALKV